MTQSLEVAGPTKDSYRVGGEREAVVAARLRRVPTGHEAGQSHLGLTEAKTFREIHFSIQNDFFQLWQTSYTN